MSDARKPGAGTADHAVPLVLGGLAAMLVLVWLWGGLAGALFGGGWPRVTAAQLGRVIVELPSRLADPRLAWPRPNRAKLPDVVGFYLALVLLGLAGSLAAAIAVRIGRWQSPRVEREPGGARWASERDLSPLTVTPRSRKAAGERRLGLGWLGRKLLRAEQRHALVVFGPPQSGKSAGLAVGALLEWDGPVIASSIKTDLLQATIDHRRALGRVFVFDPFELSGESSNTWSPLASAHTFDGALEVAHRLASAGEVDQRTVDSGEFWTVAAEQRLAPLLFAASRTDKSVDALVRWAYGQGERELDEALEHLLRGAASDSERRDAQAAFDAAAAFAGQPDRTRGSIEGTVQTLLRAYRSQRVQDSARASEITPALLDHNDTLYLVGDAKASRLLRPIFLALLGELIEDAYQRANRNGGRLERPLLLCLDELGNIAPLPNLGEIASTAPSHNIQLVSVFHDLSQAHARYGHSAETVINSHRARMLLPGVADLETLRYFSGLVGDEHAREQTRTTGRGYETRSENYARRPLAPPEQLRQLPEGHALLVYGRLPPTLLRLRMWFADKHLTALASREQ